MYHKVEIFPKNEDFLNELVEYLSINSKMFKRELSIDNILNESYSIEHLIEKLSPISVEKYGATFQSHFRENLSILDVSHLIHSISITQDKYYADIELLNGSEYHELMILRPVYRTTTKSSPRLETFDIDYDINNNAA